MFPKSFLYESTSIVLYLWIIQITQVVNFFVVNSFLFIIHFNTSIFFHNYVIHNPLTTGIRSHGLSIFRKIFQPSIVRLKSHKNTVIRNRLYAHGNFVRWVCEQAMYRWVLVTEFLINQENANKMQTFKKKEVMLN